MKQDRKISNEEKTFRKAVAGVDKYYRQKAFKKQMPYAVSRNGDVVLVYPDNHTKVISADTIKDLKSKL